MYPSCRNMATMNGGGMMHGPGMGCRSREGARFGGIFFEEPRAPLAYCKRAAEAQDLADKAKSEEDRGAWLTVVQGCLSLIKNRPKDRPRSSSRTAGAHQAEPNREPKFPGNHPFQNTLAPDNGDGRWDTDATPLHNVRQTDRGGL